MTPLQSAIARHGDLISTAELLRMGPRRHDITAAVASGEIQRIRQGWYANPWLPVAESHAARVGGQLACVSAAVAHGLWDLRVAELHVCVPDNAARLRTRTSYRTRLGERGTTEVQVHWTGIDPNGSRVLVSPVRCIDQIARCVTPEAALAVVESALHRGRVSTAEWEVVLAGLPRRVRRLLASASARSESGSESVFVFGMARIGVIVRQQVWITGVGRVDGLVGERLVIEIDSREHHGDPTPDRRRDAKLSALGYRVLRFTYQQIFEEWESVVAAVLAAISRGDHLAA